MKLIKTILRLIAFFVAVVAFVLIDYYFGDNFLDEFMDEQSLSIMGTMLAIYIATASSLLTILIAYEKENSKKIFSGTSAEIKSTIDYIIVFFAVHLFLLIITPERTDSNQLIILILLGAKILTFSLYIYALRELAQVLFNIRNIFDKNRRD